MSQTSSCAVLIHGLHLQTDNWEQIVWGNPLQGVWGNIPRGVAEAWRLQAQRIVWGTGASEKDGFKESEYTYRFALAHIEELATLCDTSAPALQTFLEERSLQDTVTTNTRDELRAFLDRCLEEKIVSAVIVPVASHAPRSIRTVLSLITSQEVYAPFRHQVSVAPSDTVFSETTMEDVVIFERPHRGDHQKNNNHLLARRTLDILKTDKKDGFLAEWEKLITQFEV